LGVRGGEKDEKPGIRNEDVRLYFVEGGLNKADEM